MTHPEKLPFVQVPQWLLLARISPGAKLIYCLLVMHVNRENAENRKAWPTRETLAEMAGFSRPQSIDKYLAELEAIGAIRVERGRHPSQPLRKRNYYFVVLVDDAAPMGTGIADLSLVDFYARTAHEDPGHDGSALERTSVTPDPETPSPVVTEVRYSAPGEVRSSAPRDVRSTAQELDELDLHEVDEEQEDLHGLRSEPDSLPETAEDPISLSSVIAVAATKPCGYRECRDGMYLIGSRAGGQRHPCPVHKKRAETAA